MRMKFFMHMRWTRMNENHPESWIGSSLQLRGSRRKTTRLGARNARRVSPEASPLPSYKWRWYWTFIGRWLVGCRTLGHLLGPRRNRTNVLRVSEGFTSFYTKKVLRETLDCHFTGWSFEKKGRKSERIENDQRGEKRGKKFEISAENKKKEGKGKKKENLSFRGK